MDWDALYVDLMMTFGWTWEYVDDLNLPRVMEIYRGLAQKPPVHWLVASYLGFKSKGAATEDGEKKSETGPAPSTLFRSMGSQLMDE